MALLDSTSAAPSLPAAGPRIVPAHSIRRRKRLERLTYGAATLGLAIGPHTGFWPAHLGAALVGAISVRHLWRGWDGEPLGWNLLKTAQRISPVLTGSGAYLAPLAIPGSPWWEWLLAPAWGAAMTYTTPLTHSADLTPEQFTLALPALAPAPPAELQAPASYPAHRTAQWDLARTTGTTRLTSVTQYTDPAGQPVQDFWGIVIAEAGEAVPDLNANTLAAVFDLPPGTVELHLIQGSGPGRKLLTAKPTLQGLEQSKDPIQRLWDEKLARPGGPTHGMVLDGYKADANRIALRISAPDDQLIQLNQKLIARALKISDLTLVMVETDGLGDGLISLYKEHPLLNVREATADDLTMAPDGTIALGQQPDGRIGRVPLYDPQMGAITDLYVGAPGAGKSVTLLHVIAAERLSGVVSIVADAQDGMSLPEVDGRVYHFGKGIAATAATLAAANDLGKYREEISAQNGWGSFEIGQPWPLVNVTLDELNRILSADAVVPRAFRKWVTGLVGDTQATGRKLGLGIRFAAQSIHLADLGDKDRIRANAKNGTVWLGRTNSSTTQHMARDGVLPPGVELAPIPRYFGVGGSAIDAAFHGKEAQHGPITAGMANIINGGSLYVNRTWFARKENKTYPHLIKLMESRPVPHLTEQEVVIFGLSYQRWLAFAEALLAGEDSEEGVNGAMGAERAVVDQQRHLWENPDDGEAEGASSGTIKDRILDLLADGQPWPLKDVRKHLDDVSPASVNNAMAELRGEGHVTAVSRGTYQIVN
ncbi:hypothetical protein ABZ829_27815 [Streptomyces xanthochromogenes]|uniref:hypothetical protein n=1 Tax=Streptomyces xanthochromogenes TaxID=67384 RepID=UPI003447CD65